MTALAAAHIDLPGVVAAATSRVAGRAWSAQDGVGDPAGGGVTIAMAAGKAFSFCYAEHPEMLRAAGAVELLPCPEGCSPTPTNSEIAEVPPAEISVSAADCDADRG